MTNIKEIVDSVIIERGLTPSDYEFRLRGCIFFGESKHIWYRDRTYPELVINNKSEKIQKHVIENVETFKIILNKALDYIIAKRVCESIDCIKTTDDMLKEVLDNKLDKILNDNNRS